MSHKIWTDSCFEMKLTPLILTPESAARVLDLLENPREPTEALRKLFEDEDGLGNPAYKETSDREDS